MQIHFIPGKRYNGSGSGSPPTQNYHESSREKGSCNHDGEAVGKQSEWFIYRGVSVFGCADDTKIQYRQVLESSDASKTSELTDTWTLLSDYPFQYTV